MSEPQTPQLYDPVRMHHVPAIERWGLSGGRMEVHGCGCRSWARLGTESRVVFTCKPHRNGRAL